MRRFCGTVAVVVMVFVSACAVTPSAWAVWAPTAAESLQIANQAWPGSPCAGLLTVQIDPGLIQTGRDGEARFDGGCVIYLSPAALTDPERVCDIEVHEAGHYAGLEHTATGIMSAEVGRWPACYPTLSLRQTVVSTITQQLPVPRGAWKVRCSAPARRMSCRASSPKAKSVRRYQVVAASLRPTPVPDGGVAYGFTITRR